MSSGVRVVMRCRTVRPWYGGGLKPRVVSDGREKISGPRQVDAWMNIVIHRTWITRREREIVPVMAVTRSLGMTATDTHQSLREKSFANTYNTEVEGGWVGCESGEGV